MDIIREDCIYARQSVDRKDSISIESQIDFCKYELKGGSCKVFKDKGYTVPRTSWELRNVGTEVSYSNAQPGDIICYAGHVGIYIGNGNIVHASTPKSGIKITTATYKSILSVRRVA